MKRLRLVIGALILALIPPQIGAHAEAVPRIAVAYEIGFLNDNGINDAVHAALELAKKKFNLVEPFVREVPTTGTALDRLTRLRFLARSGYTVIVTVGTGYRETVQRVALEYPEIQYVMVNDRSLGQLNISNIFFAEGEMAYIAGYIAALRSRSGEVAILGATPELRKEFVAGAKKANRSIKARGIAYTGDLGSLKSQLGEVDVIYPFWDADSSIYNLVTGRKRPIWYIARKPEQFFVTGTSNPRVAAVITKDMTRPISQVVELGLEDRALLDEIDPSGIFGRIYDFKKGGLKVELAPNLPSGMSAAVSREIAALRRAPRPR